ncbi:MAG: TVP38/TMEM64 family protein [Candidatus Eisenbacteria sp.]|nr:TVP38/TMEM64 family protein [Candidatus Eisenbacteria bacterium]
MNAPPRARGRLWLAAGLIVAALLILIALATHLGPALVDLFRDRQTLQTFLDRQGAWAPVALIALQVAQVVAAPIPGHLLAVASGFFFGPWLGTLYTVVGVGIGSTIALGLARWLGRPLIERMVPPGALARIDVWAAQRGPLFFFLFFLLPFLPDDLACFAVGLSPLPLLWMLLIIILARLPGHLIAAWIGATAERLPLAGWAVLLAATLVLVGLYLLHRRRIERWFLAQLEHRAGGTGGAS